MKVNFCIAASDIKDLLVVTIIHSPSFNNFLFLFVFLVGRCFVPTPE
uniref:Uncharacterized protein n=1 Tax=Meloidogyne enterolobii TaxID=390850 RepID=A0A6V7XIU1_MELEN|nr:unnamed protein product [Meloidogyne enterolobii]